MMESERERTCFITGHRRDGFLANEETIKKRLEAGISKMGVKGFCDFICGLTDGVEQWAAETVLKMKKDNPDFKLICAFPVEPEWQNRPIIKREGIREILKQADQVNFIRSWNDCQCAYLARNAWMIDHASACLAVFSGRDGRTKRILEEAKEKGIEPIILDALPEDAEGEVMAETWYERAVKEPDCPAYDSEGYDFVTGFNAMGFDRKGYDKDGYDRLGIDRNGRDRDGVQREKPWTEKNKEEV